MGTLTTVIPVYNGERYLEATLASVAAQTRLPDRLILLDNCSTDSTRAIFEKCRLPAWEWRQNESNLGLFGNLNRALSFAPSTDLLHLLMADDLILPLFYQKLVPTLEGALGPRLAYSYNDMVNGQGEVIGPAKLKLSGPPRPVQLKKYLASQSELATVLLPAVILKTDRRPPLCLFRDFPQVADIIFLAEWATHCSQIVEVPEYLCHYRLHPHNSTSRNINNLQIWVMDEWRAMQMVAGWMGETGFSRWLRQQKLKCLFAARTQVKLQIMRDKPEYKREIVAAVQKEVSPLHWILGKSVVAMRDFVYHLRGRKTHVGGALQS